MLIKNSLIVSETKTFTGDLRTGSGMFSAPGTRLAAETGETVLELKGKLALPGLNAI